jgi:hypothetical protein
LRYFWSLASHAQAYDGAETKSRDQQRHAGKFGDEKLQCGAKVIALTDAAVVNSLTEPSAPKIETQNRSAERVYGFGDLKNHLVVHGAAEKRMRMTDDRGNGGWSETARRPEDGFEAPYRAGKKKIS